MRWRKCATISILFVTVVSSLYSQAAVGWKDTSPHVRRLVEVEKNFRLEVLDWGGPGRAIILLAGGGDTAHVFDEFAPKLTGEFHVYGITRRGFGASDFSATDYGADRLGDDVLAVANALKIKRPVLVGHSIGGEEMSSIASRYPDRVAGLVYLDAAYPYAFDNGKGPSMMDFQQLQPPEPPGPDATDLANFSALQKYFERVNGFRFPEAELREDWETGLEGRVEKRHESPGGPMLMKGMKKYSKIPVPTLVIFANPHSLGAWVASSTDPPVRQAATAYTAKLEALTAMQIKVVQDGVPTAHVIVLPGAHHYVFLSNEADVLREIRTFVNGPAVTL